MQSKQPDRACEWCARRLLLFRRIIMARKPTARSEFVMFDVVYEDGSQRSNRKVDAALLGGLDGDEPARTAIMEQDRAISEKSGLPPLQIKSIRRSGK
jgi:hypothetical protein